MNIKQKLYSLGAIAILGVLFLTAATFHFSRTTDQLAEANLLVAKLEIRLLNLRRNEKDFLLRSDKKYLDRFNGNMDTFLGIESQLSEILSQYELPSSSTLRRDILAYQKGFQNLVAAFDKYGLKADANLIGDFNEKLAKIKPTLNSDQIIAVVKFRDMAVAGEMDRSIIPFITDTPFLNAATAIARQRQVIGVKYNVGLLGETRALSHTVEKQFKEFSAALVEQSATTTSHISLLKQGITLAVILLIIGVIFQITRAINLQVSTLLTVIQKIAQTNDVSLRSNLEGKDELVSISDYFNRLLDKFEQLISSTQEKSSTLSSSTSSMHDELVAVMEQFKVQVNHTSTMSASVSDMLTTLNNISENTTIAAQGVQKATENAHHGRDVVKTTVNNIDQLSSVLADSESSISSLNQHVDQIGDAVTIIQGIAEQTNLLALNAAIEAARAGEQGRGFAVVADEVRALASRTHDSTEEITKVVTAIQSQMSEVVSNITQCNEQGQETLVASQALDESLSQILSDMNEIRDNSQHIADAIEQQGDVMEQVSGSITELGTISENNMQSAQQCLLEVDQVSKQAKEMDTVVADYTAKH